MNIFQKRQQSAPVTCALNYFVSSLADCFCRGIRLVPQFILHFKHSTRNFFRANVAVKNTNELELENRQNSSVNSALYLGAMSYFLREPLSRTRQILHKNGKYLKTIDSLRNKKLSQGKLAKHKSSIRILDRNSYIKLQRELRHSQIVCTFHFGDFVYGLNALMCLENPQHQRFLLSQDRASPVYFKNISRCFGDRAVLSSNQLLASATDVLSLRELLKTRPATLTMFCDLPQRYGKVTQVQFLGRKAMFPKGPATIALASGVPLLPVITFEQDRYNLVKAFPLLLANRLDNESLDQAATRITQELVNILEFYVRKYPQQWKYLSLLPEYFQAPTLH